MFNDWQGYKSSKNFLYQDNHCTKKIELNGRNYCTEKSKCVDIRHEFIKDFVDKKDIKVEYCQTGLMLAD